MFKKFFKYALFVIVAFVCFSCETKSEKPIVHPESSEYVSSIKMRAPVGTPLLDPQMAGEEHNRALSYLVESFDSRENLTFDEIFDVWLEYANCRMSELGYPEFSEEDINMYYESFRQLNNYCHTQFVSDVVISYTNYLYETGIISTDFADFCMRSFSDIDYEVNDPCQVKESMMRQISCLHNEDEILAQNMIGIADYTMIYWNEYFISNTPRLDDDETYSELSRRSINLRNLCTACIDVLVGGGVSASGFGAVVSGLAGAVGSFLFQEAMGW